MRPDSSKRSPTGDPQPDLHERIRKRAEQIYIRNGRIPGRDLENWSQAEREVCAERQQHQRRTAIIVKVNDVQYVGEYRQESADGYEPGEFVPGEPVPVHIEGDRMFVRRSNGKILETAIVQRVGESEDATISPPAC